MASCEILEERWNGPVLVVATGASLKKIDPAICRGVPTIAVKQAWELFPWADVLFATDNHVWQLYDGFKQFKGEKWSTHHDRVDHKYATAEKYKIRLVRGEMKDGFSTDPALVHYGPMNTSFQGIQFAIHWLRKPGRIILLGMDMHGGWFFGKHPRTAKLEGDWRRAIDGFQQAARRVPHGVEIVNATAKSALKAFPQMSLENALAIPEAAHARSCLWVGA
jgi:hypothetical protein